MSIQVKSIDVYGIENRLRKSKTKADKEVWVYIKALKETLTRQQELTAKAIGKIREQENKHSYKINPQLIDRIYMVLNPPQTIEQFIEVCIDYQLGIIEIENEVFRKKDVFGKNKQ